MSNMISIGNLQINKLCLGNLEVAKAYLGDVQVYGSTPQPVGKYMTITALDGTEGTTIAPTITGTLSPNLQYRINNNGDWTDFIVGTTADIHLTAGDWVQFKGNNTSGLSTGHYDYIEFNISGNPVALSGNVMSLIDGVGDALEIPNSYCFNYLFYGSSVKSVTSDFLPATKLTTWCYNCMFGECHSLLQCPELPATKLEYSCYRYMFKGCHSLLQCPELPAMELALECYEGMFSECISLLQCPELPATTLAVSCYGSMFAGCKSLKQAPELPATKLASYCYQEMFHYCNNLVTPPELPVTVLASGCYQSMFNGCKSLVNAPALPATTLAEGCYIGMFADCDSLKQAPELPATKLASYCYKEMFWYCNNLVTPPELPVTVLASGCYQSMFEECTSLTTAPALPATTLAEGCYKQMFYGCTALTTAPELPATTLIDSCYNSMFSGCSKLNYVKSLATNITATNALNQWLSGVASTGTFVKPVGVSYVTGASGIPSGWTVVEEKPKPEGKYMTITMDDSARETSITPKIYGSLTPPNLQYRINNGSWNDFIFGTNSIIVKPGDFVQFKGVNESGISTSSSNYLYFKISELYHLSGNIMSLIDGVGETKVIPNSYCFYTLFSNSKVKTVSSDFLPATTITEYCYDNMFYYCSSLENSPELPATTLADYCYSYMFSRCSKLVNAPALPATTLAVGCYKQMFYGCSFTTAPDLPATTLVNECYSNMFQYCSNLNYVKSLATNITATNALNQWLSGVASSGTFVKLVGVKYSTGASGIPSGWTVVEERPKPEGKYMTITVLDGDAGTTIKPTANGSLKPKLQYRINSNGDWTNFIVGTTADIHLVSGDWVQFKGNNTSGLSNSSSNYLNFSISGNPVALSGNVMSLIDGIGETLVIPSDYCFSNLFSGSKVKTVSSDFLPATTLKYCCYKDMFGSCSILVQAPELPDTNLEQRCYYNMFRNCTSLKKAPELPATKLVMQCYEYMFFGCSSLNYVKCSARNITARSALDNWLNGVASTGTFVKRYNISYPSGASGIPSGWTIQNF